MLCYKAMLFRISIGYDESLDACAVHGVGGLWGVVATGMFATAAVNIYSGLLEGTIDQFLHNALGARDRMVYAFAVTYGSPGSWTRRWVSGSLRRRSTSASTSPSTGNGSPTSNLFLIAIPDQSHVSGESSRHARPCRARDRCRALHRLPR